MVPAKKLDLVEKKIISSCPNCHGSGCQSCKSKVSRIKIYDYANIPMDYWFLAFKNFQGDQKFKEYISKKLEKIDEIYELGNSFAFIGNFGTGKTYAACCILKTALVSGYSAKYYNMSELINGITSHNEDDENFLHTIINTDFLVIDEFGKRWVFPSEKAEQLFGQNLEHVLRTRFQNHLPTIVCSNDDNLDDVLSEEFSKALSSLRSRYMEVIPVIGKDFRKTGNK